ncbi:MAG: phosphodiester glycosidase family protein [Gemmatimonadaceae bacterium]
MIGSLLLMLTLASPWEPVGPGVWRRELDMAGSGPLSVVRAVAIRIDPAHVRFSLDTATLDYGTRAAWTVERLPSDGVVATNTGQFIGGVVWGWLVHDGTELQVPGKGSVAMSFVVDSAGSPALLTAGELPTARGHVRLAFQSYPALLIDSELPWELQAAGRGVDIAHRDSRLAIGTLADGSLLIVLTRFTGLGPAGATMPWGPTVGEMAAFMRDLGCQRAMLLDGGISSQLSLRTKDGRVRQWTNWRKVPMGLVVTPREPPRVAARRAATP